jgi:AcrR family transcriptional regulator
MENREPTRRRDGEATRRRVLDAVVATVLDVGYYKASSNEIARRAGVPWSSIKHLFGSREGMMLAVTEDAWADLEAQCSSTRITGTSLEDRLREVLDVLATYYEQPAYVVLVQILLDAAANPAMSADAGRAPGRRNVGEFADAWHPLFAQALGDAARDEEIVSYAFSTLRAYLASRAIAGRVTELADDSVERELLVRGVAAAITSEAAHRGWNLDAPPADG